MADFFRRRPSIAELNAIGVGSISDALGIEFTELGEDFLRGRMPVDARTKQPFGLLHGGASVVLAESLGSMAGNLCLDAQRAQAVGLEVNANHLKAVTSGWVTGTARPIHIGRSTQIWDIRIEADDGRLCCISRLTLAVTAKV